MPSVPFLQVGLHFVLGQTKYTIVRHTRPISFEDAVPYTREEHSVRVVCPRLHYYLT